MHGAVQAPIATLADMATVLGQARRARSTACTAMNAHSSRSHSVLMLHIGGAHAASGTCLRGSLNLVDLAGRRAVHPHEATAYLVPCVAARSLHAAHHAATAVCAAGLHACAGVWSACSA